MGTRRLMSDPNQVRINELARELEIKAKVLIDYLPEIGVTEKKTHSSSIDVEHAVLARKHFQQLADQESAAEAAKSAAKAKPPRPAAAPPPPAAKPVVPVTTAPHAAPTSIPLRPVAAGGTPPPASAAGHPVAARPSAPPLARPPVSQAPGIPSATHPVAARPAAPAGAPTGSGSPTATR